MRLALVIAIQVAVVALLALAAPRSLAALGNYVVGAPSRALTAEVERCGEARAAVAELMAAVGTDEDGRWPPLASHPEAQVVTFGQDGETLAVGWHPGWLQGVRPALSEWIESRPAESGPQWCALFSEGRLLIVGAAPLPEGAGWVALVEDGTQALGDAAARVAGARSFAIVPEADAGAAGPSVTLTQITSGLVPVAIPVPGMVGEGALLTFDLPTRSIGTPLRAGAIVLVASVLLLAGAQTLAFASTYVQVMQPYRDLLQALDQYATEARWEAPGGQFQEQHMAVAAITRAVEAREQAEQEARARLEELRAFVDAMPAPAAVKDAELRFRMVNSALARLAGRPPEELVGKAELDFLPPRLARVCADHDRQVMESGQTLQFEEMVEVEGRPCTLRTVKAPLKDAEGRTTGLISVAVDITGERELQARLVEAQKAQLVSRLAGGVAHIFNNVLTAIIGSSELALLDLPDEHPARQGIQDVKAAANRGARVSRQLLVLGRGHRPGEATALVHEVIEDLLPVLREVTGARVEVETAVAPELPAVMVDPGELKQVLLNLALNAAEAMPDGGRIRIESRIESAPAEALQAEPTLAERAVVVVRVSDTGTGISAEAREHMFEPFFTTKGASGGRGLGLPVVQSIVRNRQGVVLYDSQDGGGTSFAVYLPALSQPEVEAESGTDTNGDTGQAHEVILLAEDEPSVRHLTERMLASQGYTLWTATRGDEALEIVETRGEAPDLLLTDVVMPGMSGLELAEALRDRFPEVRVLLMSGYAGDHDDLQGYPLLWKPFTLDSLTQKVRSLLDSSDS